MYDENAIYEVEENEDELYHHGILGQKWGHRNGPPYPLHASAHSPSEKAAGYKKSLGGGRNTGLYERNRTKSSGKSRVSNAKKSSGRITKQGSSTKRKGLTDKQKQIAKRAAIGAAAVAATAGGIYLYKSGKGKAAIAAGKRIFDEAKGARAIAKANRIDAGDVGKLRKASDFVRSGGVKKAATKAAAKAGYAVGQAPYKAGKAVGKAAGKVSNVADRVKRPFAEAAGARAIAKANRMDAGDVGRLRKASDFVRSGGVKKAATKAAAKAGYAVGQAPAKAGNAIGKAAGRIAYDKNIRRAARDFAIGGMVGGAVGGTATKAVLRNSKKNKVNKQSGMLNKKERTNKWDNAKITIPSNVSATTKKVMQDFNNMTDQEFKNKYSGSKSLYAYRVEKYGDPYKNAPLAKVGKKLEKSKAWKAYKNYLYKSPAAKAGTKMGKAINKRKNK